jgi:heme/copper-type cytochrome/quinol oxidase subunit 1
MRVRLNFAQRVVFVVGLAAMTSVFGTWLTGLGSRVNFGWVAYAPLSKSVNAGDFGGLHPWVRLVLWLILIALWAGLSTLLLRTAKTPEEPPQSSWG